jgi:type I restriction enzyme, S subunit
MIRERYAHPRFDLARLGSLTKVVQYGTSERCTSEPVGIPVLRIPNLQVDGWDLSDLKYLPLTPEELSTYRLEKGDILFNRTNGSRELVGKCEVFNFDGDWVFASYLIRLRIDTVQAFPEFVTAFLNTFWGRRQVEHVSRQILMSNINAQEIRALQIPLPRPSKQRELLAALDAARGAQLEMLKQAEELFASLDTFVLNELALNLPATDNRMVYAIRLHDIQQRFDPDYNSPRFRALRAKIEHGTFPAQTLGSLFYPIVSGFAAGRDDQTDDPTMGVPHIRPLNITNTAELTFEGTKMVPRLTVEPGDFLKKGEILFNNTNSTAWVGKTVVFDADRDCACSNHITRLTLIDRKDDPYYFAALFNALRSLGFFGLLSTNFNNQAGINVETLKEVRLPTPKPEAQHKIAAEVAHRRDAARRLRSEARTIWEDAKHRFEEELLGPDTNKTKMETHQSSAEREQ